MDEKLKEEIIKNGKIIGLRFTPNFVYAFTEYQGEVYQVVYLNNGKVVKVEKMVSFKK
jgi:hypothetical protein